MTDEIIKKLQEEGLRTEDIKSFPAPLIFADIMPNQPNAGIVRRLTFESFYHKTTKLPQSFFYKHVSTIANIGIENV